MIYLDNSATTNKKPILVKLCAIKSCLRKNCLNPNRGGYREGLALANKIFCVREKLSRFFNCKNVENCIFTSGCTEALNLAILGSAKNGGHVITTIYEHNSVLRPLNKLKETSGVSLTFLSPNENGEIETEKFEKAITKNTYMIACSFTSNVTGYTNQIEEIGKLCKKYNILFLVDCAQSAGHEKIDMQKMNIDFLALAGHKGIYSLSGIGALLCSEKGAKNLRPIKFGGTGTKSESLVQPTDFPDGFESGTNNVSGILSLGAGLDFVEKNQNKINKKIYDLTQYLVQKLKEIEKIKIYPFNNLSSGVISFNVNEISSNDVSNFLSEKFNICVRSGLHCAPLVHKFFKTQKLGMVRVSVGYFNNKKDIDKLAYALKQFVSLG